jgi:hypothetical protein
LSPRHTDEAPRFESQISRFSLGKTPPEIFKVAIQRITNEIKEEESTHGIRRNGCSSSLDEHCSTSLRKSRGAPTFNFIQHFIQKIEN